LFGVYPKPVLDMSATSVQLLVNNYNTAIGAMKAAACCSESTDGDFVRCETFRANAQ